MGVREKFLVGWLEYSVYLFPLQEGTCLRQRGSNTLGSFGIGELLFMGSWFVTLGTLSRTGVLHPQDGFVEDMGFPERRLIQ